MNQQLDRIGRQLEAIELALAAIQDEHDHEQRTRWLEVVSRASTAVRQDYEDVVEQITRRPALRLLKGGGAAAATTGSLEWLRHTWRTHPQAGMAAAAAAVILTAAVVAVETHGAPDGGTPSATGPITATTPAQPPPAQSPPAPSRPPATPGPPQVLPPPRPTTGLLPAAATQPAPATSPPPATTPTGASSPPASTPPQDPPTTVRPTPSPDGGQCLKVILRPILGTTTCILNG